MALRLLITALLLLPLIAKAERNIGWETFNANIVEHSSFTVGAEFIDGRNIESYEYDGLKVNAPDVQLNVRLGDRGEAYLGYTLWRTLRSDEFNAASGGDPWFYTKLNIFAERDYTPTTSFIWGVLEPAANRPTPDNLGGSRVGADILGFYALLAFSKTWHDMRLDVNYGAGIYEDYENPTQDDVTLFNAAVWYQQSKMWHFGVEYNYADEIKGFWLDPRNILEDSPFKRRRVAATAQYGTKHQGYATLSRGLLEQSEDWGLAVGLRYGFR